MSSVAFYLPDHGLWPDIDVKDPLGKALGGRETAAIRLSQELAVLGWRISIYGAMREGYTDPVTKVEWEPLTPGWKRRASDHDVTVSCEHPEIFDRIRSKLNICHYQCCHTPPDNPVTPFAKHIDNYFILSNYQRYTLCQDDSGIDPLTCVTFGNGVDLERYDSITDVPMVPGRLTWSSSPDRGLHHLLRWWPTLKEMIPELSLRVFYSLSNMNVYKFAQEVRSEWAMAIDQASSLPGVELVGKVDQVTLAREQKASQFWCYPCDPIAPTETFCITALENAAARIPMLMSTADCLPEIYGGERGAAWFLELPVQDRMWISAIAQMFTEPEQAAGRVPAARRLAEAYTWAKIAQRWSDFLEERLNLSDPEKIHDLVDAASVVVVPTEG